MAPSYVAKKKSFIILHAGANCIKFICIVNNATTKKTRVFVPSKYFQIGLNLLAPAFPVQPEETRQGQTVSLFCPSVLYKHRSFIIVTPGFNVIVTLKID